LWFALKLWSARREHIVLEKTEKSTYNGRSFRFQSSDLLLVLLELATDVSDFQIRCDKLLFLLLEPLIRIVEFFALVSDLPL
jgi:hypothetical protein